VQASGGVLLAVGLLFLASAVASLLVPVGEAADPMVDYFGDQPGGDLVLVFPEETPANVTLRATDGEALRNATAEGGRIEVEAPRASMLVEARQGNVTWNRTVLVVQGDRLELELPPGGGASDTAVLAPTLAKAMSIGRYVFLALALALVGGGVSALTLRVFALAAVGALVGAFLGLLAVIGFLALGLLFALPFGLCAYFILRGRRHFRRKADGVP
jgi:hypothetical protein